MNLHAQRARVGAVAVTRGAETNPFDFVFQLVEKNKGTDKKSLFDMFREEIAENDDYQRAIDFYFFTNAYEAATSPRARSKEPRGVAQRGEQRAEVRKYIEQIQANIILLDHPMTNGKLLGDCTGDEVATLGNRFQKLAARVGKGKTVRAVLTEDQVKEIMK